MGEDGFVIVTAAHSEHDASYVVVDVAEAHLELVAEVYVVVVVVAISMIATEEYVVDFIVVGDSAFAVMVVEHTKFVKKLNRL